LLVALADWSHSFPLLHFVLDDLPSGTKAPELDDSNAVISLEKDAKWSKEDWSRGSGVSVETMGVYIAYLIAIGFLPPPQQKGERELPNITLSAEALQSLNSVGGRGGAGPA
jgi:L-aminoadipate-semialdehyde dehydrogenase